MIIAIGVKLPIIETDIPRMVKIPPPTIPPNAMAISSAKPRLLFLFLCCVIKVIV
jgi:hypothetical protein